jgi:hypothetical protein
MGLFIPKLADEILAHTMLTVCARSDWQQSSASDTWKQLNYLTNIAVEIRIVSCIASLRYLYMGTANYKHFIIPL